MVVVVVVVCTWWVGGCILLSRFVCVEGEGCVCVNSGGGIPIICLVVLGMPNNGTHLLFACIDSI